MKKWIISIAVFVLLFILFAFISFYAAIILVGPHSDILPEIFVIPVVFFLLALTFGIPSWISYKIFNRYKAR